ncbi:cysteine synthase A [Candidatus Epulonipiscioides gigas]|nr:cysteine synthase A [Epulopiscium sp. SCG-C07WGA-EpuloA2]
MIYNNITELIGKTPVIHLEENLYAKLEYFNPGGSIKDRTALFMLNAMEIKSDTIIIEPTSGNTGIGIAMICAAKGIKCKIIMPDTMSIERIRIIKAYGAEVILTDGKKGMKGAIEKAHELLQYPNHVMCSQFTNMANVNAHKFTTALEIIEDIETLDYFVSGIGTGGTITGTSEILKLHYPDIKIIAIEPDTSPVLTKNIAGSHKIQGIGAGFKPGILNMELIDKVETISYDDAVCAARKLATKYGILAGFSGGANYHIAQEIAQKVTGNVLFIVPDNGERYLSTELYN